MVSFHEADSNPLLPIPSTKPLCTWTNGSKFKLMVEFQVLPQSSLILRLEHEEECFSTEDIYLFEYLLEIALESLVGGNDIHGD